MRKQTAMENPNQETASTAGATVAAVLDAPTGIDTPTRTDVRATDAPTRIGDNPQVGAMPRKLRRMPPGAATKRFSAVQPDDHATNRQAELFYLQKQIQLQTQMVLILEDGSRVQGVIEWYDRSCIKVRGKSRVLVYKSAVKYLYKAGEMGSAPE
jgi:sRNA-binding regulator protein Hfq